MTQPPVMLKIKPATDGLLVRLEDGSGMLDALGQAVPATSYYRRRLMDGDVIELTTDEANALDARIAVFEKPAVIEVAIADAPAGLDAQGKKSK